MSNHKIAIVAAGLVTSIGFNYEATSAALRAGISNNTESRFVDPVSGNRIFNGRVKLPQWWEGRGKLVDLVSPAIRECIEAVPSIPPGEIPILLGVAAKDRPSRFKGIDDLILSEIEQKLDIPHHQWSKIIPEGRVSGIVAIHQASVLIRSGAPCCIIACVDSLIEREAVKHYINHNRLLTESNSNGFTVGEAGTAVLVMPQDSGPDKKLVICGIGFGEEKGTIESDIPLSGDGMTNAFRDALNESGLQYFDMNYRITDLNGEHYKFLEARIADGRLARKFDEQGVNRYQFQDLWHPIEYTAEIGAAISPCLMAWALHAGQYGYASGPYVLMHVSNDNGKRAALIGKYEG